MRPHAVPGCRRGRAWHRPGGADRHDAGTFRDARNRDIDPLFWVYSMTSLGQSQALLDGFLQIVLIAVDGEDKPMIEVQQAAMQGIDFWAEDPDDPGRRCRRGWRAARSRQADPARKCCAARRAGSGRRAARLSSKKDVLAVRQRAISGGPGEAEIFLVSRQPESTQLQTLGSASPASKIGRPFMRF